MRRLRRISINHPINNPMTHGITISMVANGYLVYLPLERENPDFEYQTRLQARYMAEEMKEKFHGDELLNKLKQQSEENSGVSLAYDQIKNHGTYFFSSVDEVTAFVAELLLNPEWTLAQVVSKCEKSGVRIHKS